MPLPVDETIQEFQHTKSAKHKRNRQFEIARRAMEGDFDWPQHWEPWKDKIVLNMVRRAVLTHANFLMGRGFTTQVQPLGTGKAHRAAASKAEKALYQVIDQCGGWQALWRTAKLGSLLGTSGWRVEQDPESKKASFKSIQPEYVYPIPASDDYLRLVKVYYAYSIDRLEAARKYGGSPDDYKSELETGLSYRADYQHDRQQQDDIMLQRRRVPVVECWTDDDYLLLVGGRVIYNDRNTYGFVPFVIVPNDDSGRDIWGHSDVDNLVGNLVSPKGGRIKGLNQSLNEMLSDYIHITRRWMNPTLVWYGAPTNYAQSIAQIQRGGGVLTSPGNGRSRIEFLQYAGQPPDVRGLLDLLRISGIEVTGLNELAWSGTPSGSINTGPSLQINFTNVQATLSAKQNGWEAALKKLFWMLLALGEQAGDLGYVDNPKAASSKDRGMALSGKDIGKHRDVKIVWPGLMPSDDIVAARFELEKHGARAQSKYTTLENLGVDFPEDELSRIEDEMEREGLNPDESANLMRAGATQMSALSRFAPDPVGGQESGEVPVAPPSEPEGDLGVPVGSEPEVPQLPSDLDQLTDTPMGYGTTPDGRVTDREGRELDPLEEQLLRLQASRQQDEVEGFPPAEEPTAGQETA